MTAECFLGIDTSNYTTSLALCSREGEILLNLKRLLPVKDGECGLRQSDAVFAHVKNLPELMAELRPHLADKRILAVGYSARPRQAEGSYMPCFLAGKAAAESISATLGVPSFSFSHQDGHITAALYSAGQMALLEEQTPFAAFHVSGGTTEVLLVQPRENGLDVSLVGETSDLNAGQAIDRVGVMMGLSFPCGREMEALAATSTKKPPSPRVSVKNGCCNLSGLQNLAEKLWRESGDRALVSAFVFSFLARTLERMTEALDLAHPGLPIFYAGGVMSNRYLQSRLSARGNTYFAEPVFSADNAAGIALLCRAAYEKNA